MYVQKKKQISWKFNKCATIWNKEKEKEEEEELRKKERRKT